MLYEPTKFDALIDEPWVPARVEAAIAAIVADADAAFDPMALWPAHEWDAREKPLPLSGLYVGAAGVMWALDQLRKSGHAESACDLAAAVVRAVELERATPDFSADEHYRPGALMSGETGALLVAFRLTSDPALADEVHALVRGNVDNPTDDISWGAPGTLLAALAVASGPASRAGRKRRASRRRRYAPAAATTGCGGRTTTTAASACCTALPATRSPCSGSSRTMPSRARPQPCSPGTRSTRTASPTGPARRVHSSRGRATAGSASVVHRRPRRHRRRL